MKFIANHNTNSTYFTQYFSPVMVSLMQFFGALLTEIINILSICSLSDTKEVVMNFIALGVISQIDNFYLVALPSSPLKERLKEPIIVSAHSKNIEISHRNRESTCVYWTFKTFHFFEASIYYYFTPFIVLILTYLIAG